VSNASIKIGDRIVVKGWPQFPTHVVRIFWEDGKGNEVDIQALAVTTRLELEWDLEGKKSRSKVHLHQEGDLWYRYDAVS